MPKTVNRAVTRQEGHGRQTARPRGSRGPAGPPEGPGLDISLGIYVVRPTVPGTIQ